MRGSHRSRNEGEAHARRHGARGGGAWRGVAAGSFSESRLTRLCNTMGAGHRQAPAQPRTTLIVGNQHHSHRHIRQVMWPASITSSSACHASEEPITEEKEVTSSVIVLQALEDLPVSGLGSGGGWLRRKQWKTRSQGVNQPCSAISPPPPKPSPAHLALERLEGRFAIITCAFTFRGNSQCPDLTLGASLPPPSPASHFRPPAKHLTPIAIRKPSQAQP